MENQIEQAAQLALIMAKHKLLPNTYEVIVLYIEELKKRIAELEAKPTI